MYLRNKVAGGDINKPSCGKRQEEYRKIFHIYGNKAPRYCPQDTHKRNKKIIIKCLEFTKSAVYQNPEIAYLLRDLVQDNHQSSNNPEMDAENKAGPDNQAISKIMDPVSYKIKVSKGMDGTYPFVAMAPV